MMRTVQAPSATSSGGPILLFTDIVSGSATNGEGGAGSYLTLYGINFGTQAAMGTAAGAQVTIGGAAVANYRYLVNSKTWGIRPGFPNISALCVQVGSAAVQALTAGSTYGIVLSVGGVFANTSDVRGNAFTFTIQPGHFWFVDTVNGAEATGVVDDITHPFRYIQNFGGGTTGATTGIWLNGNLAAGDTIIIRGNNGTPISDQVGYQGRMCRWSNRNLVSGTAPTGVIGHGYVHFTSYPGPINGNAPEDVYIFNPANGLGGFMGASAGFARPNAPNAGQYWSCSNMRGDTATNPSTANSDVANWNLQSSADHTRFVNLDIQWNSTTSGVNHQKNGGISGDGDPVFIAGNYIHNIAGGDSSALENHGIYMADSPSPGTCAHNVEIQFNVIVNCTTGQGIQFHRSSATDGYFNEWIHHNWVENTAKYGMKLDAWSGLLWYWNNVIVGTVREGFQVDGTSAIAGSCDVHLENNTFYNCYSFGSGSTLAEIGNGGSNAPNTFNVNNNIFAFGPSTSGFAAGFVGSVGGMTFSNNLYYDYSGRLTTGYSGDASGHFVNPQFANTGTFPNFDAQIGVSSGALGIAVGATINPVNDLGMNKQPRAGQTSISTGAFA